MSNYIPLSVPNIAGNEWKYVKECLDTGWVSSAGPFVNRFEEEFRNYVGAKHAVACASGTAALHIAMKLVGVGAGDLVLAPSLTFIASINAITYLGAEPFFFDSDEFYNLEAEQVLSFLKNEVEWKGSKAIHRESGKRIGAVMAVHVFGNAANLFELEKFCSERGLPLIEDAAESLGTRYNSNAPTGFRGKHTGTIGKIGCVSFNGNKILTTGGGGMIVTDDAELAKKAKYLTTQSKDDELYFVHNEIGYNYRMTNVQAAMGVAQLEKMPEFLATKKRVHENYQSAVAPIPGLRIAGTPAYSDNNYWLNCLQIGDRSYGKSRDELLAIFKNERIEGRPVWRLNHLQRPYANCHKRSVDYANSLLEITVCLPSSTNMTAEEQERVISVLNKAKG